MKVLEYWQMLIVPSGTLNMQHLWQLLVIILLFTFSSKRFSAAMGADAVIGNSPRRWLQHNRAFLVFWASSVLALCICWVLKIDAGIFRFMSGLGGLWIIIGLLTSCLPARFWAQSVAALCYLLSALYSVSLVNDSIERLEDLNFTIGTHTMPAWSILSGIIAFAFSLWLVLAIAGLVETQIQRVPHLSASLKVLITKIIRIIFIFIATAVALSSMGIDLSALTVLGGAIGLGVGFGLQKVVSNFISGILLLVDNSIKPGDVIEIDGTYGWINHLRARYVSVITRDGTEHLIPNEDLITQHVINWTFTNNLIRMKIPIGVSYDCDPHQCIQLVTDAAQAVDRVLDDPLPVCHLLGFGDNSVDLELRFWISDPTNGVANVKSDVLLKIWDTFKVHGIEIPYPQRDLHLRSSDVRLASAEPFKHPEK